MEINNAYQFTKDTTVQTTAAQVGKNLSNTEKIAFEAYSLEDKDKTQITDLARSLGATEKEAKSMNVEGLRILAKRALDKAQSLYEALSQLFQVKKRAQDSVINNIGR